MAGVVAPTGANFKHKSRGLVRIDVDVTTDASGDATLANIGYGFGRLRQVFYDGGLDASASISLKDTKTGAVVFGPYTTDTEATAVTLAPTIAVRDVAGTAVTPADTAPNVNRDIFVNGKLSLVVASGGNAETCKLAFVIDEDGIGDLALTV